MVKCPNCGTLNEPNSKFCISCGQALEGQTTKVCPRCGTTNTETTMFCSHCGYTFSQTDRAQKQPIKRVSHRWPWILGTVVIILFIGFIFILRQSPSPAEKTAVASSSSSSDTTESERASLAAENASLKASTTQSKSEVTTTNKQKSVTLSEAEKQTVTEQMLNWADSRAQTGNMAVSNYYFNHGAAGSGDWYAQTPDGEVQVQDNNNPGTANFKIHAIGGLVFYTSKDGTTGVDDSLDSGSTADGYTTNMNFDKPVSKYLLADNGVVYELKSGNGTTVDPLTGFGEYNNNGTETTYKPDQDFTVSNDSAATNELQDLLEPY
ncbi:hypothetical protein BSQ39_01815 [Loigolactobacillus backii]|uniref:zinc ribbon domain-containing protein n=1 Tax=Loigolactobacillus TaxID=2767889 RepID=UPI000C1C9FD5|nr:MULTISPECIES: zinc ribbon domain-containing protein [Loigolactobacillus]PIO82386.1 hypothetical protein BSQ39_01815 [Loigolactobacillus backii]